MRISRANAIRAGAVDDYGIEALLHTGLHQPRVHSIDYPIGHNAGASGIARFKNSRGNIKNPRLCATVVDFSHFDVGPPLANGEIGCVDERQWPTEFQPQAE